MRRPATVTALSQLAKTLAALLAGIASLRWTVETMVPTSASHAALVAGNAAGPVRSAVASIGDSNGCWAASLEWESAAHRRHHHE